MLDTMRLKLEAQAFCLGGLVMGVTRVGASSRVGLGASVEGGKIAGTSRFRGQRLGHSLVLATTSTCLNR